MTRFVAVNRLVDDLKDFSAHGFDPSQVRSYLEDTLVAPESLEPYVHPCEEHYTRNLVHKDGDFELLIICWGLGHKAPIHGHEGELCFARVERGTLRFRNYEMLSEDPLELQMLGDPLDGSAGFLDGPADIHSVENLRDFGGLAVSCHVYSKPYGECDIYDSAAGPRRRVKLGYDSLYGERVGGRR